MTLSRSFEKKITKLACRKIATKHGKTSFQLKKELQICDEMLKIHYQNGRKNPKANLKS
jgi:hypothetical protein